MYAVGIFLKVSGKTSIITVHQADCSVFDIFGMEVLSTVALNVTILSLQIACTKMRLCSPTVTCMLQLCLVGCD
jgi:hypothetical protein